MAESNQSKQNREQKKFIELKKEEIKLSGEALDFEKEMLAEKAERSKFEKEILSFLREQSISIQIMDNLTSDTVDELREQTNLLKEARSFQAESVRDLKEKLGLGDVMNDKQKKLAFISSKINILQQDKNKELHKEQIQQLQLGQSAIKNSLAIDQAGEAIELIVGGFANIISSARKFSVIVSGVGLAALWLAPLIIVVGLLSMAVSKFIHLDKIAESVRKTTGLMKSQTEALPGIIASTQKRFAFLGITMEDVGEIFTEIKSEFTDALSVSQAMVDTVSVLNKNFGIGISEATKFFLIVRSISGESTETAAGLAEWVISIARINKIAPQKIFEDMANSAEDISIYFRGNIRSAILQTAELRRMGSSLDKAVSQAKSLLDFESSITAELEASVFLGRSFNLQQARSLAFAGNLAAAREETLDQIQKIGGLEGKNMFVIEKVLAAVGMTAEEVNKELDLRSKLLKFNIKIRAELAQMYRTGVDISKLSAADAESAVKRLTAAQEMQSLATQFSNTWDQITTMVAGAFLPLIESIAKQMQLMLESGQMEIFVNNLTNVAESLASIVKFINFLSGADDPRDKSRLEFEKQLSDRVKETPELFKRTAPRTAAARIRAQEIEKEIRDESIINRFSKNMESMFRKDNIKSFFSDMIPLAGSLFKPLEGIVPHLKILIKQNEFKIRDVTDTSAIITNQNNNIEARFDKLIGSRVQLNTNTLEGKIDELIVAVKQTKDVYMDGRKVTKTLIVANDRPT